MGWVSYWVSWRLWSYGVSVSGFGFCERCFKAYVCYDHVDEGDGAWLCFEADSVVGRSWTDRAGGFKIHVWDGDLGDLQPGEAVYEGGTFPDMKWRQRIDGIGSWRQANNSRSDGASEGSGGVGGDAFKVPEAGRWRGAVRCRRCSLVSLVSEPGGRKWKWGQRPGIAFSSRPERNYGTVFGYNYTTQYRGGIQRGCDENKKAPTPGILYALSDTTS